MPAVYSVAAMYYKPFVHLLDKQLQQKSNFVWTTAVGQRRMFEIN